MFTTRNTLLTFLAALAMPILHAQSPDFCPCRLEAGAYDPLAFMQGPAPAPSDVEEQQPSGPIAPEIPWYVRPAPESAPATLEQAPAAEPATLPAEAAESDQRRERVRKHRRNRRFRPERRSRARRYRGRCPKWL